MFKFLSENWFVILIVWSIFGGIFTSDETKEEAKNMVISVKETVEATIKDPEFQERLKESGKNIQEVALKMQVDLQDALDKRGVETTKEEPPLSPEPAVIIEKNVDKDGIDWGSD